MSKPSPTTERQPPPPVSPKPRIASRIDEVPQSASPRSSPLVRRKPLPPLPSSPKTPTLRKIPPYLSSIPNTPPRSPLGESKFLQHSDEVLTSQPPTFGSNLQTARDPINARHDCELQALESFRGYVRKRAKAEAEYAAALAKIHGQTSREMTVLGKDSPIVQAWNLVLESMAVIQERHSSSSKHAETNLLSSIDELIRDKRELKKVYDISRSQLEEEYRISCSIVQKRRREYINTLQSTEIIKRKLDVALKKPSAPNLIERLRKKYTKGAKMLHTCHNDYTLSLLDANCHQRHYNKSMLPFCLNTLQEWMQLFVSRWKVCMEDYAHTLDMSKVYQDLNNGIDTNLHQLKPEQEYTAFIEANKCDQADEEEYIFDASLLKGYCSPIVEVSKLSLNNLTHEKLVIWLATMEQRLIEYTKYQSEKSEQLSSWKGGCADEEQDSQMSKIMKMAKLEAELKSLDCIIEKEKLKIARVKEDLNELNGFPPPLFEHFGEESDGRNKSTTDSGGSMKVYNKTLQDKETMIKQRSHGKSHESVTYPAVAESAQDPYGDAKDKDGIFVGDDDDNDDHENDDDAAYEDVFNIGIESEPWFYGDIERTMAEQKCKNHGDYLVRYSPKQNKFVLTVNCEGQQKHFIIRETDQAGIKQKVYYLEAKQFPSVKELLDFYNKSQLPVSTSGALLIKPVIKYDKWQLQLNEIKKIQNLGKGEFGEVYEAEWNGQRVAVKTCHSTCVMDKDKFFKEVEILKQHDHPNIIKLIGYCWNTEPLIVMELMTGGSLLNFLKKNSCNSKEKLLHMAIDACSGMAYLEKKSCIHRDLAARNCLVRDNEIVKISDFGMSHDDCVLYQMQGIKPIPIKWTAPEALKRGLYTSASDVWSYGVLLWEVFSGGITPYVGMTNIDVKNRIEKGYRMTPPADCPEEIYKVMMLCWTYEPDDRPKFSELCTILKNLQDSIQ